MVRDDLPGTSRTGKQVQSNIGRRASNAFRTKMILRRLQLFSVCILATLSLIASPISACVCSYHEPAAAVATPHPEHSHTADHAYRDHDTGLDRSTCAESSDGCVCAEAAPKTLVKSEIVKIQKESAVTPVLFSPSPPLTPASVQVATPFAFAALPAYVVSPPSIPARGPPRS